MMRVTAIHDLSLVHPQWWGTTSHGIVGSAGRASVLGCAHACSGGIMLQIKGKMNL